LVHDQSFAASTCVAGNDGLVRVHPEMVFFANLGVNLHVCLCGDHQVASAQMIDSLDIGQTGTCRETVGLSTRSV